MKELHRNRSHDRFALTVGICAAHEFVYEPIRHFRICKTDMFPVTVVEAQKSAGFFPEHEQRKS